MGGGLSIALTINLNNKAKERRKKWSSEREKKPRVVEDTAQSNVVSLLVPEQDKS